MGLIAGINAFLKISGETAPVVPETTAHGALIRHITDSESKNFQPSNINFGLFSLTENIMKMRDKKQKRKMIAEKALSEWEEHLKKI